MKWYWIFPVVFFAVCAIADCHAQASGSASYVIKIDQAIGGDDFGDDWFPGEEAFNLPGESEGASPAAGIAFSLEVAADGAKHKRKKISRDEAIRLTTGQQEGNKNEQTRLSDLGESGMHTIIIEYN